MNTTNFVWFHIFSGNLQVDQISEEVGVPLPPPNSLGKQPKGKSLPIYSEDHLPTGTPLIDQMDWMLSYIRNHEGIMNFLSKEESSSTLSIYTQTDQDNAYLSLSGKQIEIISKIGCSIKFKMEKYD